MDRAEREREFAEIVERIHGRWMWEAIEQTGSPGLWTPVLPTVDFEALDVANHARDLEIEHHDGSWRDRD